MSNDHIFAAQMWSWTDPMIKRDSHGRILIVNAAFLQLYGGSVETWTGNPIEGWPAPKSPGEMSRFESRIPLPTGGETVYDWMECTHQDGTALAMARDVTAYAIKPVVQPEPTVVQPVQENLEPAPAPADFSTAQVQNVPSTPPLVHQAPEARMPAETPQPTVQAAAPIAAAPEPESSPIPQHSPAIEQQPFLESQLQAQLQTPAPVPAVEIPPAVEAPKPAPVQQITQPPETFVAPQAAPRPSEPLQNAFQENRAMEKRALPIEDGDAILGNNWRDAVIAKAVGVEDTINDGAENDAGDQGPTTLSNTDGDQVKVLLAEDNAINALLTRTLLEAEGCQCDVVEDGALAVEAVKNNEYHMVFMDMRMPNMDGLEATRKIRSLGYNAKILPIVALTANAFDDDRNACFDSGMNDFMTKPVSAEELSAMVKTHTALEAEKIAS